MTTKGELKPVLKPFKKNRPCYIDHLPPKPKQIPCISENIDYITQYARKISCLLPREKLANEFKKCPAELLETAKRGLHSSIHGLKKGLINASEIIPTLSSEDTHYPLLSTSWRLFPK